MVNSIDYQRYIDSIVDRHKLQMKRRKFNCRKNSTVCGTTFTFTD